MVEPKSRQKASFPPDTVVATVFEPGDLVEQFAGLRVVLVAHKLLSPHGSLPIGGSGVNVRRWSDHRSEGWVEVGIN